MYLANNYVEQPPVKEWVVDKKVKKDGKDVIEKGHEDAYVLKTTEPKKVMKYKELDQNQGTDKSTAKQFVVKNKDEVPL